MATTTTIPNRPRRRSQQPRVSVRAPETVGERDREDRVYREFYEERGNRLDLLTAALVGLSVGAGLTFLLRRGPDGERPFTPLMLGVGRGAGWAGRRAARLGTLGRWAADRGGDMLDRFPRGEIREHIGDYIGRAREAIDDAVSCELRDLRRAVRRQRRHLGL